ncbi:unnamed protein product [Sphagnum jensenii]|uniref:Pentatricopeptide repeat-containing protein n=1 Tax=Sphagnum jensenii TaxID=128206 RepID=A0ABP1BL78_9BRYO
MPVTKYSLADGEGEMAEMALGTVELNIFAWNKKLTKFTNRMPSHDVVSSNAIPGGCAMDGHSEEALKHFEQMCAEGVQPNGITFVCLLSACSHAGLVDEVMHCYASMTAVSMISAKLEHCTCIVELAGHLQEAENMVKVIPCEPNVTACKALISTCRIHGYVKMGEHVAK